MKKILGVIAILGIGAIVYSQYKKAKDKQNVKLNK
jgi:hypothetical protein